MEANEHTPGIDLQDTYNIWVPIEENDLVKSLEVDENGDYIVQGVMTSDVPDEEDDVVDPSGMDCTYFLSKGWVKYEHGNRPDQYIGEPIEVKLGQFEHPRTKEKVNGILIKSRLFANRSLTQSAVRTMQDLHKSNTKRCMGWSIEAGVKERDRKTGKVLKSILRNVVLTMNPVNTTTWAELSKSFAKNHELTIDMDTPDKVNKSMDIAGAAAITPQDLEGAGKKKKKDPQQEWINTFRAMVDTAKMDKSFQKQFVTSSEDRASLMALDFALKKGLDYEEAEKFASYIAERRDLLKSLIVKLSGGENMGKSEDKTLNNVLDEELEELQKSLELEDDDFEDDDDEELTKSMDDNDDDNDGDDDDNDGDDDGNDGDDGDDDDNDDDEDKGKKKPGSKLRKSLSEDKNSKKVLDVSDFMANMVDEIGFTMEGMNKSITTVGRQQSAVIKAMSAFGSVLQDVSDKVSSLEAENAELKKSLSEALERPIGRKSVVSQREAQTLSKSLENDGGGAQPRLNRDQITDVLVKSFNDGDIGMVTVSKFEAGVPLSQLHLPQEVKQKLGIQ